MLPIGDYVIGYVGPAGYTPSVTQTVSTPTEQITGDPDAAFTLAPFGDSVSEATRTLILEREQQIKDGTFSVFPDTVIDQDGNSIPLGDIFSMDYFVQGVIGSPKG